MKVISSFFIIVLLLLSQSLCAHGNDHKHVEITEDAAQELALKVARKFSSKDVGLGFGQLSDSWSSLSTDNAAIFKKGTGYYIVSVHNKSDKNTLYVLMNDGGKVRDANLTGIFEGFN